MPFELLPTQVPGGFETAEFLLRPIRADDAALDHAAVMESRELLRIWEQSTWPEDDFTVAANREDLEMLEDRHARGVAFAFTVMTPDESECLGCVYFMAADAGMYAGADIVSLADRDWSELDAAVYFWVRQSHLADGLDRALLDALRTWIATAWPLEAHVFVTNRDFTQQVEMLDAAGLERVFEVTEADKPTPYIAFEDPRA